MSEDTNARASTATDELLFPGLDPRMPFAGLTRAKIPIINDALGGRLVLIAGGSPGHIASYGPSMRPYFFGGIGTGRWQYFPGVAELVLCEVEHGEVSVSVKRHVCASLITAFEPYGEELLDCYICGMPKPRADLWDLGSDFACEPPTLECRSHHGR